MLNEKFNFVKKYNDFWWLTDPEKFILKHYPEKDDD